MNQQEDSHYICLTFVQDAEPGKPLVLDKEATEKLGEIPKLLRALAKCYGPTLSGPTLWGGVVHLSICSESELFDFTRQMVNDLETAGRELKENAQRKPPLPLMQAVTHPHCIDLLRVLSKTHEKSKLTALMFVAGNAVELPHIPLASFTEPNAPDIEHRHLRANVIGLCRPTVDSNVLVMADLKRLELPTACYAFTTDDLYERVVKASARFVGQVEIAGNNMYRAKPEGTLESQLQLQVCSVA